MRAPAALETAGGIFNALPLLGPGPFLVVNGDTWTRHRSGRDRSSRAMRTRTWCWCPIRAHHLRGDFGLEGDFIVERDSDRFTYSGVGIYRPEFFAGCEPGRFPLLPLLKRAIAARKLRGQLHRGDWCDVGTPERLAALEKRVSPYNGRAMSELKRIPVVTETVAPAQRREVRHAAGFHGHPRRHQGERRRRGRGASAASRAG